jgi:hypothetical protein
MAIARAALPNQAADFDLAATTPVDQSSLCNIDPFPNLNSRR